MALADILGIEVIESTPNKYVTHMLVTEDMLQPMVFCMAVSALL